MRKTRRACWRRATAPVSPNLPSVPVEVPLEEEELTAQQLAEIEWVLELIASAECAMGVDYPEGPLSPSGCRW